MHRMAIPALVLALTATAAAQEGVIPDNSSWEQVRWTRIHGWCMAISFLVMLPLGSLTARYLRAFLPLKGWLSAHALVQLIVFPVICVGFGAGVHLAKYNGQWLVPHTKIGLTLFLMYWIQVTLGVLTASTPSVALGSAEAKPGQPDMRHPIKARPWYALLHAFWGVSMCIMASVQVRRGYTIEWPAKRGQPAAESVNRAWKAWVVIIPVLYLGGLFLLKRQWAQERARMQNANAPSHDKYESVATSDVNSPRPDANMKIA